MKSVAHIFGSETKVKIMRLFIFNQNEAFTPTVIAKRVQESPAKVRHELGILQKSGLVRKRPSKGYILNKSYAHLAALESFLIDARPLSDKELTNRLSHTGNLKLIFTSGVFLHDPEARVDLLVVGDHLKQGKLVNAISGLEAEIGRELRYAAFETPDFKYRLGLYDKLVRDILDYPHQKVLNKLNI
jgi:hypothetical protein